MQVDREATEALSEQIHTFDRWKTDLTRSLKSFRLWLGRNQLSSDKVDQQLSSLLKILKDDYVTIAFAGEFSRGKTELINAMFFANYGQRILPSQAGRTTMCPTELFYDKKQNSSYLRLLPIETRSDPRPLTEFRHLTDHWLETPLNTLSADSMAETMQQVTETQFVSPEVAEKLGFSTERLERQKDNELVEIPKWRHALVSFAHPLLKKGLCILDTPGLNALGSEPELTLGLLPRAQAVIFLLAADAGVTKSDMDIWEEHISQLKNRPNLGLYAVLNKVDVLWDELSSASQIKNNVNEVINSTARQLGIARKNVIPVSAQKGLLARVKNDDKLLQKSQLNLLEDILSNAVMVSKGRSLWENVIADARTVVNDSFKTLENRRSQLLAQRDEIEQLNGNSSENIESLLEDCRDKQQLYKQQLLTVKPSIRLMERQCDLLKESLSSPNLQIVTDKAANMIIKSKTTVGMLKGMREFFFAVDAILIEFCHEAELSNKMASSIYNKFQQDHDLEQFEPRVLTAKFFHRELKEIIRDSDQFNQHLKLAFSGQHQVVNRFFNTTVHNINNFFDSTLAKLDNWSENIMHPLIRQVEDHRDVLELHMSELKSIRENTASANGRLKALNTIIGDSEHELSLCADTLSLLDRFQPVDDKNNNVVPFRRKGDDLVSAG